MDIYRESFSIINVMFIKSVFFIVIYLVAQINAVDYYWDTDMVTAMHGIATLGVPIQVNE